MKSFLGERDLQLQTTFSQNLKSGTYLILILNASYSASNIVNTYGQRGDPWPGTGPPPTLRHL